MEVQNQSPQISQVSRQRAALGEDKLSYETQQAVQNGALPPSVNRQDQPAQQEQTQQTQAPENASNNASREQRTTVYQNEAVQVDLSQEARSILAESENQAQTNAPADASRTPAPIAANESPVENLAEQNNSLFNRDEASAQDRREAEARNDTVEQALSTLSQAGLY